MAEPFSYRRIDQLKGIAFDCGFGNEHAKQFGKLSKTATWEAMLETYGVPFPADNKGAETKLVRIPIAYVDKILRVVDYMDANEGQLPQDIAFFTEPDSPLPGYKPRFQLPYPKNYSDIK
jgi:hypothetical protein